MPRPASRPGRPFRAGAVYSPAIVFIFPSSSLRPDEPGDPRSRDLVSGRVEEDYRGYADYSEFLLQFLFTLPRPREIDLQRGYFLREGEHGGVCDEAPALARFAAASGTAVSRLVDLGTTAARVVRIESVQTTPSDSALFHYYRLSDELARPASADASEGWIPYAPGAALPVGARGRWLQLLIEFFPDGRRTSAPTLSNIRVVYEPHLPPLAPAGLVATPRQRQGHPELAPGRRPRGGRLRGVLRHRAGSWFGDGAAEGPSPIDAGDTTGLVVTGLENGRLYYFTVAAYNDAAPKQRSAFAAEAGARPSRIHP